MPKGQFKQVLEALTGSITTSTVPVVDSSLGICNDYSPEEFITEGNFQPCNTVRHGFPYKPTTLAYDPVQKLLAIGSIDGYIRILGQAGVDCCLKHEIEGSVLQIIFLSNQGALISVCSDNSVHLWNFRQKKPAILHSLNFKRENITFCHLPHQSSWLYIGTEKGNTYICNIESFIVSGYAINWNKTIDIMQKTHPGSVISICENPIDESKVLIVFESGVAILWELKNQNTERRYKSDTDILCISWHSDGKRFIFGHVNGCLTTWDCGNVKPVSKHFPHAQNLMKSSFYPIHKIQWLSNRSGNDFIIFSGGLPTSTVDKPSITVMKGHSIVALKIENPVVDFTTLSCTPWLCDYQNPQELAILTVNELIVVDLNSPGYPQIKSAHPMDIHNSPVTCLKYVPDPSNDLIPDLYKLASTRLSRTEHSKKEWPINGGQWNVVDCLGKPELFVTGHADGCVRFWDASAVSLKPVYKLRTKKIYKKDDDLDPGSDDLYQASHILLCPKSRTLVVSNGSAVIVVYKLSTQNSLLEINTLYIRTIDRQASHNELHGNDFIEEKKNSFSSNTDRRLAVETDGIEAERRSSVCSTRRNSSLRVKSGHVRQCPGFQAELACLISRNEFDPNADITYLAMNSSYQLLACGTTSSISVIDMLQKSCLFSMCTNDLLKSINKRIQLKTPTLLKPASNGHQQNIFSFDHTTTKCPTDEPSDTNGKSFDAKMRWKAVTKKSRNATKSIGDYFSQSRSILTFRRSSLLPKSSSSLLTTELSRRSASNVDVSITGPETQPSPDADFSPSTSTEYDVETFDSSVDAVPSGKVKFVTGDDDFNGDGGFKFDPTECGLRSDSRLSKGSSTFEFECASSQDYISYLTFSNSYTKQSECTSLPCLWVGTSAGYFFSLIAHLSPSADQRTTQPTVISPSGSVFQMKGGIVYCNFLDSSGNIISPGFGCWRDHSSSGVASVASSSDLSENGAVGLSAVDKQFVIVCSEQQAKIFTLPSHQCIQSINFNESTVGQVVKACTDTALSDIHLACITTNGYIIVYNLPSLCLLLESPYLPSNDARILKTFCFGVNCHAIYMGSPSEVQRLTYSLDALEEIHDYTGHLFVARKSPERPSIGFLNGLFGGGYNSLDRQELFAHSRASRGVAEHVPGTGRSSIVGLRGASGVFTGGVNKLQMQLHERGDNLVDLDDKVERMCESAQKFSSDAHALMTKNRNKKWYQI